MYQNYGIVVTYIPDQGAVMNCDFSSITVTTTTKNKVWKDVALTSAATCVCM